MNHKASVTDNGAVCADCGNNDPDPSAVWVPVDTAYPDGFTCADCGEVVKPTQPEWALTYKIVIVKHGRFRYYGRLYTRLVCADSDLPPTPWRETNYFTGITRKHTHYVLAKVGRDRARVWRYDQRHPINPEAVA